MTPKQFENWLKRNKLSQRNLALELDVSRNTVAYYLNGTWEMPRVFDFALHELERRLKERNQ